MVPRHAVHGRSICRHAIVSQVICMLTAADAAALLRYNCRRMHSMCFSRFGRSIQDVFCGFYRLAIIIIMSRRDRPSTRLARWGKAWQALYVQVLP